MLAEVPPVIQAGFNRQDAKDAKVSDAPFSERCALGDLAFGASGLNARNPNGVNTL